MSCEHSESWCLVTHSKMLQIQFIRCLLGLMVLTLKLFGMWLSVMTLVVMKKVMMFKHCYENMRYEFIDSCAKVEHQLSSLGVSWPDWIRFQSLSGMFIDHDMPACGDWNRRVEVQIRCTSTDWFFLSGSKARVLHQGLWITSRRNISKFCQRQTLNTLQQRKYGWMSRSTTNIGDMCVGQRYKRWLEMATLLIEQLTRVISCCRSSELVTRMVNYTIYLIIIVCIQVSGFIVYKLFLLYSMSCLGK